MIGAQTFPLMELFWEKSEVHVFKNLETQLEVVCLKDEISSESHIEIKFKTIGSGNIEVNGQYQVPLTFKIIQMSQSIPHHLHI